MMALISSGLCFCANAYMAYNFNSRSMAMFAALAAGSCAALSHWSWR
jgi:hypothetical protein